MALIRLNNQSISSVTALPSGIDVGKVLQVVQATYSSTNVNTTSTTFVATGLDVNITPSSTSNKILILGTFQGQTDANGIYTIYRDSTNLLDVRGFFRLEVANKQTGYAFSYLDSPSSTSQINYELFMKNNGSGTVYFHPQADCTATIQAIEIGA